SITNIGVKPTVSNQNIPNAETHIIGLNQDLYGKEVTVVFHDFLRSEMKFNSRDELKNQLKEDIKNSVSTENAQKALAK
ncbi:MAG: riboflavin kinase, partial [Oscillospiraceae bacterium]